MHEHIIELITYEQVKQLKKGESLFVGSGYEVYRYEDAKNIVVIEPNESEEVYCILLDDESKTLLFEGL